MKKIFISFFLFLFLIWLYSSSLIFVLPESKNYLTELKSELLKQDLSPALFIISGKRYNWDNWLLSRFGGAAKNSRHLKGEAIDIIVLDVNNDGVSDSKDVDIVYQILDKKIIRNNGGIGTYKNQKGFFNRQMIHFDSRGTRARWHR